MFITNSLYIKNIESAIHILNNFIYIFFDFFKINNDSKPVLEKIIKEVYLIKRLKAKI